MKRVAILGLGLMGGSIGLALRRLSDPPRTAGYARSPASKQAAVNLEVVDELFDRPETAAADADFVVVCTPVAAIPAIVEQCRPAFRPGCLVTDVGSTKEGVVRAVTEALRGSGAVYVGSHPMTGSEQAGVSFARAELYDGSVVVLTPETRTPTAGLAAVAEFWQKLGARTVTCSPAEHDRIAARTSHLPHVVSAALMLAIAAGWQGPARDMCGPGIRGVTRLAEGSPTIWRDILFANREAVLQGLREFSTVLAQAAALVENGTAADLEGWLEQARDRRLELLR